MFLALGLVMAHQFSDTSWLTQELRVEFRLPALHEYSGCYQVDPDIGHAKRKSYNSHEKNAASGAFGYCEKRDHWILFKGKADASDPCDVKAENMLAYSADTDTFDIYSSFDETVNLLYSI